MTEEQKKNLKLPNSTKVPSFQMEFLNLNQVTHSLLCHVLPINYVRREGKICNKYLLYYFVSLLIILHNVSSMIYNHV